MWRSALMRRCGSRILSGWELFIGRSILRRAAGYATAFKDFRSASALNRAGLVGGHLA
ncbi:protein of unknown function [Azospirillum baldaniorum]|uniref:Uncharacterized protein n=1 Tax=Azospirillum baldaniorum TaxID=1064539 RepID=A0A9P1JPG2_9PROT|nr:protein of unknown function [Azospirillum baldaniorum]